MDPRYFSNNGITFWSNNIAMNIGVIVSAILFLFLFFLFTIVLLSIFTRQKKYPALAPHLSIIIPTYNEEKNIVHCLDSITTCDYDPKALQILVADDGSTDQTAHLAKEYSKKMSNYSITVLELLHRGKSAALNAALARAKHAIVLNIDADVRLRKDTLAKLVQPFSDEEVAATNTVAMIREPKGLLGYFQMVEFCLINLIRVSLSSAFHNSVWFFGAAAAYRRDALLRAGGFSKDTLTEDMDICLSLYREHYNIVTVRDARIFTNACPGLRSFFRQRMRWYFGALQTLYKHRGLLTRKKRSPSVDFLFLNQIWWTIFAFLFFPLTAYQVYFWFPTQGFIEGASYLVRWFSLLGPFYVLAKIPLWGINFLNLFSVLSGVITFVMMCIALILYDARINLWTAAGIVFFFPYTILLNLAIILGVAKHGLSRKKYFVT